MAIYVNRNACVGRSYTNWKCISFDKCDTEAHDNSWISDSDSNRSKTNRLNPNENVYFWFFSNVSSWRRSDQFAPCGCVWVWIIRFDSNNFEEWFIYAENSSETKWQKKKFSPTNWSVFFIMCRALFRQFFPLLLRTGNIAEIRFRGRRKTYKFTTGHYLWQHTICALRVKESRHSGIFFLHFFHIFYCAARLPFLSIVILGYELA